MEARRFSLDCQDFDGLLPEPCCVSCHEAVEEDRFDTALVDPTKLERAHIDAFLCCRRVEPAYRAGRPLFARALVAHRNRTRLRKVLRKVIDRLTNGQVSDETVKLIREQFEKQKE